MLIYLIIAAELAILYTVFWYVYVRDPKPYKIVGNPWGKYGDKGFTAGGADPTLPFAISKEKEFMTWWHTERPTDSYPDDVSVNGGSHITRTNSLHYRRMMHKKFPLRHEPCRHEEVEHPQEQAFITRVLGMFTRTLDALNVKSIS